jgi:transcriptional regulator with XRE-family HTH domain
MSERTAITQEDLAGRLAALEIQIDRSALARIESGQRLVKDIEVAGLAAALRVPIERLFSKA